VVCTGKVESEVDRPPREGRALVRSGGVDRREGAAVGKMLFERGDLAGKDCLLDASVSTLSNKPSCSQMISSEGFISWLVSDSIMRTMWSTSFLLGSVTEQMQANEKLNRRLSGKAGKRDIMSVK